MNTPQSSDMSSDNKNQKPDEKKDMPMKDAPTGNAGDKTASK